MSALAKSGPTASEVDGSDLLRPDRREVGASLVAASKTADGRGTLCKSVRLSLQDLAVARLAAQRAGLHF